MIKHRRAFIIGIKGLSLTKSEILFIKKYKPWGVILFSRNVKNIDQVKKLTDKIKKIYKDNNYPILIDQEGGRVSRLNNIILTSAFSSEYFGKVFERNKFNFKYHLEIYINQVSYILEKLGVNINTSPLLDIRKKKSSLIIGDRSFSSNPRKVKTIGELFIKKFHKNRIGTVIKHIPGHGLAKTDSHFATPVVKKSLNYLIKNDFYPFKNQKSIFAMTAHIIYQKIDPQNTATHSKKIIKLIRNKINFKDIIISDDISMKALKFSVKISTQKAFKAGCNLVLHCNARMSEMIAVAQNSPILDNFLLKKTQKFYKLINN